MSKFRLPINSGNIVTTLRSWAAELRSREFLTLDPTRVFKKGQLARYNGEEWEPYSLDETKNWEPQYPGATMTFTGVTKDHARYCLSNDGKWCDFYFRVSGTLGGAATNYVEITLPRPLRRAAGAARPLIGYAYTSDGGGDFGFIDGAKGSDVARVYRGNAANFTLAAGVVIKGAGRFEVA